jgi:peptide-methionine (R)-S-oxide reductase
MRLLLIITMTISVLYSNGQINQKEMSDKENINKSEDQWKQELTDEEYAVLRNCGTEPPFTGKYYKHDEKGTYQCAACGAELFSSDTKYDSGSGWPSFYNAIDKKAIKEVADNSLGMRRIEIKCAKCDGHLGHVFPDGPKPTGMRYCVNSISLDFKSESSEKEK